jgi:hypothetical protein
MPLPAGSPRQSAGRSPSPLTPILRRRLQMKPVEQAMHDRREDETSGQDQSIGSGRCLGESVPSITSSLRRFV